MAKDKDYNEEAPGVDEESVKPDNKKFGSKGKKAAQTKTNQVAVTSLLPVRYIVSEGKAPSGKRYEFPKAGTEVLVDAEDVEFFRAKNSDKETVCCGGKPGKRVIFNIAVS